MNLSYRFLLSALLAALSLSLQAQTSRKIKLTAVGLGFDLPESYKQRTFIKGLAGFVNKIDQLVGSMVIIEGNKTSVLTRFVRQDKPPIITTSTSDVIYSSKIDSKFKFNGSYSIASTKVEKDQINELIITDIAYAFLPEDYIPYLEICRASGNVTPETRAKTYYVRSAKLTTVYTRAFRKIIGDTDVNGVVFSVGGEVFSSSDQFRVDYIVSVDLVSLERLLSLQNCNDLINSEELARREKVEQAKTAAQRAKEEKEDRENELNAAKAQVEDMKRLLMHNLERSEDMQRSLKEAQDKERLALEQLQKAIHSADELSVRAQNAQIAMESRENMILTFKNKDGKVLEIKSLEELSAEKLKELGFDIEVLKTRE
jgi:hypothetical protein